MKFQKRNCAGPIILAYLEANPDSTAGGIRLATGLHKSAIDRNVRNLLKAKAIHISSYHPHEEGSGKAPRCLSIGPGQSAKRPKLTPDQTRERQRERQRAVRLMERVAKESQAGPFGILVVQMQAAFKQRNRAR